jgi:hypothetical protein
MVSFVLRAQRLCTDTSHHRTLQEAVLAKSLLFHFADRVVDLRDLWQDARTIHEQAGLKTWALSLEILLLCRSVRLFFHAGDTSAGPDLANIAKTICYRDISDGTDEPFCINTILNLDRKLMAESPNKDRMETLWRNMPNAKRGIPKEIIFSELTRLASPGFRWAPSTVRQPLAGQPQLAITENDDPATRGTLTLNGLKVKFPGWRVRMGAPPNGIPPWLWAPGIVDSDMLHLRTPDGHWFWVSRPPPLLRSTSKFLNEGMMAVAQRGNATEEVPGLAPGRLKLGQVLSNPDKEFVLILEKEHFKDDSRWTGLQQGLIASIFRGPKEPYAVHSEMIVRVTATQPNDNAMWQAVYEKNLQLRGEDVVTQFQARIAAKPENEKAAEFNRGLMELMRRVMEIAREALQEESLKEVFQNAGTANPEGMFGALLSNRFTGRYLVVDEVFDGEHEWCVD